MTTTAILVAAGRGTRAGGDIPKQWQQLGGQSVAAHAIARFMDHARVDHVVLVLHADDIAGGYWSAQADVTVAIGGATRSQSVLRGLQAVPDSTKHVLIHDAARPHVSVAMIDRVLVALETHPAAAPAIAVTDTLWHGIDDKVHGTQDRAGLYRAQTPQGFHLDALLSAYADHPEATDDVTIARLAGLDVAIVTGDEDNMKITGPDDHARAARILGTQMDVRLGNGYDVHRFGEGDHVWLCGVKVPHDRCLQGHSDADVGMHAVTDAIYGALGQGDIGQHFPPSDPQWKGAASRIFLEHAVALAHEQGFQISNVDCTLVCEYPKIGPHQTEMKAKMADIMGLDPSRISVKATTSERLGFTGRSEGIASIVTAALVKP
ncbi:2-C-methyl-D-erythritol 4-phosphate cytidylyltransferase/2-C-methyl-D-erythritol 2,4-cyclodiphosphate synthase [Loktanella ponticola]|uniref:Bifunctional enzyme IspD/IspF n=1 Tax=Yoonia ponticola TaxID=1524255 RepID=A0A7W9BK94_9RHOB|nr:bifunctional 2-C-methyl-D-erythritol 4-phosphate cytidylyltransferase/2-C-methyl-D-erythritol 2,4-cyclodiphosphate synthase [Yoonia ponticola]MBB5721891.1 2-C-methyl-D-erythritol 4-phosphate cytidylyltransferase/2-C-methyl-D-erythritol 2,4-cyclodiphosphate synthase [Yoonia ponticola]